MDIDKIQTDIHSSFQYILRFKKKRQCIMKTGLRTFYDSFYLQKCSIFISGYFVLSLMTRTRVNVYVQGEYVTQKNIDKNVFIFFRGLCIFFFNDRYLHNLHGSSKNHFITYFTPFFQKFNKLIIKSK